MYLPLEVNTPVLAGGLIAHFVSRGGSDAVKLKRKDRGTLLASGFVAGGAIMGVIASFIKFGGIQMSGNDDWSLDHVLGMTSWLESPFSAVVTLVMFCGLGYFLYHSARGAAKD
jgi:hypothetical protein